MYLLFISLPYLLRCCSRHKLERTKPNSATPGDFHRPKLETNRWEKKSMTYRQSRASDQTMNLLYMYLLLLLLPPLCVISLLMRLFESLFEMVMISWEMPMVECNFSVSYLLALVLLLICLHDGTLLLPLKPLLLLWGVIACRWCPIVCWRLLLRWWLQCKQSE